MTEPKRWTAYETDAVTPVEVVAAAERERLGERLLSDEAATAARIELLWPDGHTEREDARVVLSAAWRVVTGSNA